MRPRSGAIHRGPVMSARAPNAVDGPERTDRAAWSTIVAPYQQPSMGRALWQLTSTLLPYLLLWYVMYHAVTVSVWLALPPALLAGAFLVRLFIIFHDCGHGSYFRSRRANDIVGFITGALTFTPYEHWR